MTKSVDRAVVVRSRTRRFFMRLISADSWRKRCLLLIGKAPDVPRWDEKCLNLMCLIGIKKAPGERGQQQLLNQ